MGRAAGLAVVEKYGSEWMRTISNLPPKPGKRRRGRPTLEETAEAAWADIELRKRTHAGTGGKVLTPA